MKKKYLNLAFGLVFGLIFFIVSSCAQPRANLVDSGVLTLEQQARGKVYIAWADAYEDEGGFVVTGVLRRHDHVGLPIKTHVNIVVLSPDGTIIDEARSSDVYVSRRITRRGYKSFERFKVRFPGVPAQGSSVRITSHSGRHDGTTAAFSG